MLSLKGGPITGQDWCLLTNKGAAIVLCMYMASKIDNFAINMVGSRQKLQFISKQNRQKMFTLSPCPQGNNCRAEEKRGKLESDTYVTRQKRR